MTVSEYRSERRKGKRDTAKLSLDTQRTLHKSFIKAGKNAAKIIRGFPNGFALTVERKKDIKDSLDLEKLRAETKTATIEASKAGINKLIDIDSKYVYEALQQAGLKKFTLSGVTESFKRQSDKILKKVNYKPVVLVKNFTGYTLSDTIWNATEGFSDRIIAFVEAAIKQGIDPKKIANDLEKYLYEGAEKVIGTWGVLQPGTREYIQRLGKSGVDYRTMMVVRTELMNNIRKNDIAMGVSNPGSTGMYEWSLSPARIEWKCNCPERAAGGPYTKVAADELTDTAHPNCHVAGTMIKTIEGEKPIEEINPNDYVLTDQGNFKRVDIVWKTAIENDIYTITTNSGQVKCTGEHPLFVNDKWVEAKSINNGDNILCINRDVKSFSGAELKAKDSPSIGNKEIGLFRIIELLSSTGVPVTAIHLNGEFYISESKINIKNGNSELLYRSITEINESIKKQNLITGTTDSLTTFCFLGSVFNRLNLTSDSIMRWSSYCNSSGRIASNVTLTNTEMSINAMIFQDSVDNNSINSEFFPYHTNRETIISIKRNNKTFVTNNFSTHNETIVDVSYEKCKCMVYNLTVEDDHTFIANGFISHNCGCMLNMIMKDHDVFLQELLDYKDGKDTPGANNIEKWVDLYYVA